MRLQLIDAGVGGPVSAELGDFGNPMRKTLPGQLAEAVCRGRRRFFRCARPRQVEVTPDSLIREGHTPRVWASNYWREWLGAIDLCDDKFDAADVCVADVDDDVDGDGDAVDGLPLSPCVRSPSLSAGDVFYVESVKTAARTLSTTPSRCLL